MKKSDINNLSDSILEEVEDFITKANKIKKIISTFKNDIDLMKDDITESEVVSIFRKLDIDVSDVNSSLSSLLGDSKKLHSFLNEVKLLKRRREERLNKETESGDSDDYLSSEYVNKVLKELSEQRQQKKQWLKNNSRVV